MSSCNSCTSCNIDKNKKQTGGSYNTPLRFFNNDAPYYGLDISEKSKTKEQKGGSGGMEGGAIRYPYRWFNDDQNIKMFQPDTCINSGDFLCNNYKCNMQMNKPKNVKGKMEFCPCSGGRKCMCGAKCACKFDNGCPLNMYGGSLHMSDIISNKPRCPCNCSTNEQCVCPSRCPCRENMCDKIHIQNGGGSIGAPFTIFTTGQEELKYNFRPT